jgi:hypothetical protein
MVSMGYAEEDCVPNFGRDIRGNAVTELVVAKHQVTLLPRYLDGLGLVYLRKSLEK